MTLYYSDCIYQVMCIWVISTFQLLSVMLLQSFAYWVWSWRVLALTRAVHLFFNCFVFRFYLERGRKLGRERNIRFSGTPNWGLGLQPRHVSQTGNRTSEPLVHRPALNPVSHTSQSRKAFLARGIATEAPFPSTEFQVLPSSCAMLACDVLNAWLRAAELTAEKCLFCSLSWFTIYPD